jgi:hypothetical protein
MIRKERRGRIGELTRSRIATVAAHHAFLHAFLCEAAFNLIQTRSM